MADVKPIFLTPEVIYLGNERIVVGEGYKELTWEETCQLVKMWEESREPITHD